MHRRYDKNHVPIELLRTLVAIAEVRSFTRAGDVLGLTQSAISAQIKRLEKLVGGCVFEKAGGGLILSPRGETVLRYAERILRANDQLLSRLGGRTTSKTLRIGLPRSMAGTSLASLLQACARTKCHIQIHCDRTEELAKAIDEGHLDIAFLIDQNERHAVCQWDEPTVWVSATNFLLSPEASIPLVNWPSSTADSYALAALGDRQYHSAFVAEDYADCITAVEQGLGYLVLPRRAVPGNLKVAIERYLPSLPSMRFGMFVGEEVDYAIIKPVIGAIETALRPLAA